MLEKKEQSKPKQSEEGYNKASRNQWNTFKLFLISKIDKLPVRWTREKERRHNLPIPEIKCYIIRD